MPDKNILRQLQALPLSVKVIKSQIRIREWYEHFNGDVCVSFSGGKDSTVLAHLVHDLYPEVPLVFANTGLEYPEIQAFARKMGAEFVRPKMQFSEVISKYGYPIISKENSEAIYYARKIRDCKYYNQKRDELTGGRKLQPYKRQKIMGGFVRDQSGKQIPVDQNATGEQKSIFNRSKWLPLCRDTQFMISHKCCSVMKKGPMRIYQMAHKVFPLLGTLTEESKLREQAWMRHGCNAFDAKEKTSQPLSFWTEQDILHYIHEEGLEIASVYGDIVAVDGDGMEYTPNFMCCDRYKCTGCDRTGCIFCGFGAHLEKGESRFQKLAKTHPKQYEYCMNGGQWVDNPAYDPVAPEKDGDWVNWNPRKIWVPSKHGLGMRKVFEDCNQIYGKDFIKYE